MEPMEVSEIVMKQREDFGSYEASVRGDHLTSGNGGYYIIATAWGTTEKDALRELAAALSRIDFGASPPRGGRRSDLLFA
jgi:hypothetical protein